MFAKSVGQCVQSVGWSSVRGVCRYVMNAGRMDVLIVTWDGIRENTKMNGVRDARHYYYTGFRFSKIVPRQDMNLMQRQSYKMFNTTQSARFLPASRPMFLGFMYSSLETIGFTYSQCNKYEMPRSQDEMGFVWNSA